MAKLGFFRRAGNLYLPIGWLGGEVEDLKNSNRNIVGAVKRILSPEEAEHEESFDDAMKRLNLSDADIKKSISRYQTYVGLFLLIAILLFSYSFYLLFAHISIIGFLLSLTATVFCLTQAFRFDFWAYQMKNRKLGVSFNEWKQHVLGIKGKSQ